MPEQLTPELKKDYARILHGLTYEDANTCVQCGYCLPVCPTYDSMENEAQSPRGRINLVKMASEGKISLDDLQGPIEMCLGCRACEVACPVNVPYGDIYESALNVIAEKKEKEKTSLTDRNLTLVLGHLFPYKNRLRTLGNLTWLYQTTKLDKVMQETRLINTVSKALGSFEKVLAPVEAPNKRYKYGETYFAKVERKMTVAFFPGCIMDAVMSKINRLTIELLQAVGCDVIVPKQATCCGALHAHQGKETESKRLAKQNIEAFEDANVAYIVNNAGGCGAMLVEYHKLLKDEPEWKERSNYFVERSKDISQVLVELGPLPFVQTNEKVKITYQDSCHLRNVQKVVEEPRKLMQAIPSVTYIEMNKSDLCCASGGIYNLLHFDESMKILDKKMIDAKATRAEIIVTTNPGCLLQMRLGIERAHLSDEVQALHLVELLADACGIK